MNFSEIPNGAAFYVISTNGGLNVIVGTVKGKSTPYWPMSTPSGFNSQVVDITISVNGQDRVVPGLPIGLEVAGREPEVYTGNRDVALRIIDEKVAEADKVLKNLPYYQKVMADGTRCKETIDPGYAQTRKQAETIENLKAELAATKGELQGMKDMQARTLELLEKLSGAGGTDKKKKDS